MTANAFVARAPSRFARLRSQNLLAGGRPAARGAPPPPRPRPGRDCRSCRCCVPSSCRSTKDGKDDRDPKDEKAGKDREDACAGAGRSGAFRSLRSLRSLSAPFEDCWPALRRGRGVAESAPKAGRIFGFHTAISDLPWPGRAAIMGPFAARPGAGRRDQGASTKRKGATDERTA